MTNDESNKIDEVWVDWNKEKEEYFNRIKRRTRIRTAMALTFPLWIAFALFYVVGSKMTNYVLRETMGWK